MEIDTEQKLTAAALLIGLAQTASSVAGVVAALSFLPSIPYALLAGMETNRLAANLLVVAPALFATSAIAAICCIARFTIIRFVLAVVPVSYVFVKWLG